MAKENAIRDNNASYSMMGESSTTPGETRRLKVSDDGSILNKLTGSLIPIDTPVGFRWTDNPLVGKLFYNSLTGKVETTLDVSEFDPHKDNPNATIYYVNGVGGAGGSDSNSGLTKDKPLRSLRTALLKPDVDIVEIAAGTTTRAYSIADLVISRSVTIRPQAGSEGQVVYSGHDTLTFTLTPGTTKTYQASRTTVLQVFDAKFVDDDGDFKELTKAATQADVETTPGSWFTDGTLVFVHTSDERAPDTFIRAYMNTPLFHLDASTDIDIYIEGMILEGGHTFSMRSTATGSPNVYVKNCISKYCNVYAGGFEIQGARTTIFQDCVVPRSENDGFNYHTFNNITTKAIEINCVGRDNGVTSDTDNGSTMHDGGTIIRVNGKYYRNKGPNVADVDDNTQSWNLGCIGYKSLGGGVQECDFQATDGAAEIWLDSCVGYSSAVSLNIAVASAKAYVRNCKLYAETLTGKKFEY